MKPTKENPNIVVKKDKNGNEFYTKEFYNDDGTRVRMKISDKEYYEYLKSQKENGTSKPTEEPTAKKEEVPKEKKVKVPKEKEKIPKEKKEKVPKVPKTIEEKIEGRLMKNDEVASTRPTRNVDGDILEVIAKFDKIKVMPPEEDEPDDVDENGRAPSNQFIVSIIDRDGKKIEKLTLGKKHIVQLGFKIMSHEFNGNNYGFSSPYNYDFMVHGDAEKVQEEVNKGLEEKNPWLLFRLDQSTETTSVYSILTLRWMKTKIQDVKSIVEKVFDGIDNVKIETTEDYTGKHGGHMVVMVPHKSEILDMTFHIDAGELDGFHAMKIRGGCKILACKNQLSFDGGLIPTMENQIKIASKCVHSGDGIEDVEPMMKSILDDVNNQITTMVDKCKAIKVSFEQMKDTMIYFVSKNRMTRNEMEIITKYLSDETITQNPSTLYGLAMAVSYYGSHEEKMKDNKRVKLSIVAGELFLVSNGWEEYQTIISPFVEQWKKDEEERLKKVTEKKLEAEEKAKARQSESSEEKAKAKEEKIKAKEEARKAKEDAKAKAKEEKAKTKEEKAKAKKESKAKTEKIEKTTEE